MTSDNNNSDNAEEPMSEWMKIMLEEMDRKRDEREQALEELARRGSSCRKSRQQADGDAEESS